MLLKTNNSNKSPECNTKITGQKFEKLEKHDIFGSGAYFQVVVAMRYKGKRYSYCTNQN